MAINDTIKEAVTEASKNVFSSLLESLQPYLWIVKVAVFLLVLYIVFRIYKSISKLQDHYRLIRIEDKLDLLLSKSENNKKPLKIRANSHKK